MQEHEEYRGLNLAYEGYEDDIKVLSHAFEDMMQVLFKQKGASLRIGILRDKAVTNFIGSHSAILDRSMETVSMSDIMRDRLSRSNYIFSGMKTFHELNEAFPRLIDEDGNRKSFERFLKEVRSIDETYNRNYLRAEYNFVNASASMAAKWEQFEDEKERYHLQYRTVGDERVREDHARMDRITLPVDDPFWNTYYPPNGWGCRCSVIQVRKSKYPVTPSDEAHKRVEGLLEGKNAMFRFNPGKELRTTPKYNPYTIKDCKSCPVADNKLAWQPNRDMCRACVLIRHCHEEEEKARKKQNVRISVEEKRRIYEQSLNKQFKEVYRSKSGGVVKQHVLVDKNDIAYERELRAAGIFADNGRSVLRLPEVHASEKAFRERLKLPEKSNPDLRVDGTFIDVKSPFSIDTVVASAMHAARQGAQACITDDHCVISKNSIPWFTRKIFRDKNYPYDVVYFIIDGVLYEERR